MSDIKAIQLKSGHTMFYLEGCLERIQQAVITSEEILSDLDWQLPGDQSIIASPLQTYALVLAQWSKMHTDALGDDQLKVDEFYMIEAQEYFLELLSLKVIEDSVKRDKSRELTQ